MTFPTQIFFTYGSFNNNGRHYALDTAQNTTNSRFYEWVESNGTLVGGGTYGIEFRKHADGTTHVYANSDNNVSDPYNLGINNANHSASIQITSTNVSNGDYIHGSPNRFRFNITNDMLWPTGPTVTSITDDKIFVPSDTVTNTDFTLLKNGSAYANTNISVTLGNFDPVDQPRFYDYSLTYNGTALYSRTIDSKSFHDLYYDDSWTSSPTSGRSTNSSRILAVLGTLPITANFTVPTVVGQTIGTRTFHDLNRSMRVILTYPAGSTHTQFICYFHVSEINNEIKGKFQSHTLDVTVFDESPFFIIGAQPDRYPLIMTNLFNRNRSLYSIGMTHKDTWDLFL
jgi:hypothetical protein